MTTNGVLLADRAPALRAAGLHRLTVSLDTLRPTGSVVSPVVTTTPTCSRASRPRGAPASSGAQARHRGDPRRQRRRDRGPDRVQPRRRRRGAVHRVHGRGRRHRLVDGPGRVRDRDAGRPRGALRTHRAAARGAVRAGRSVSPRRRARVRHHLLHDPAVLSPRATGAASPPMARGSSACTRPSAPISAGRSAPARRRGAGRPDPAGLDCPRRSRGRGAARHAAAAAPSSRSASSSWTRRLEMHTGAEAPRRERPPYFFRGPEDLLQEVGGAGGGVGADLLFLLAQHVEEAVEALAHHVAVDVERSSS